MKKKMICWVVLLALAMLGAQVEGAYAQKTMKLRFAAVHGAPGMSPLGDVLAYWQQEVTRRTNGAITFESHWHGSMGAPAEHLDLIKSGVVQAAQYCPHYTPTRTPLGTFEYSFPFAPTNMELVCNAINKIRAEFPEFAKEWNKENIVPIIDLPQGTYLFLSRTPIRNLEDFKGKKVALAGRYFGRTLPPGASPVVRPGHDRYDMLKNGVVTIDLQPWDNQYLFKLSEVTSYCLNAPPLEVITGVPLPLVMNMETYNKLSPDVQKTIMAAGKDAQDKAVKEIFPRWWQKVKKEWETAGMKFLDFPKADIPKWVNSLEDIPAEFAAEMDGKGLPGTKIMQRWQEITADMGYKWPRKWGVKK